MSLHLRVVLLAGLLLAIAPAGAAIAQDQPEPEPLASVDNVEAGTTSLELDETFTDLLQEGGLTLTGAGAAELSGATAQFPITAGELTVYAPGTVSPFVQGELRHDGGLQLEAGNTRLVTLGDFRIDPDTSTLSGDVSVAGIQITDDTPLFFLDGRTLEDFETGEDGQVVLDGATVKLQRDATGLLNAILGTDALTEGLTVGTARIVVEPGG